MSEVETEIGGVDKNRLKSLLERIEHMEEEKKSIQDDIKDIYAEAKGAGFDTKALKQLVKMRKKSKAERDEEELIYQTYAKAVGLE